MQFQFCSLSHFYISIFYTFNFPCCLIVTWISCANFVNISCNFIPLVCDGFLSVSLFSFPLCLIFTSVSCALLICVWLLHQYLVNFFIFRLVRLLRKYHADFFFPCSPNCHVSISCPFSFPFCPIVTLVSRALFVFPIVQSLRYYLVGLCFLVRLLRKYLVHFLFSCLSNCLVFILCAFCFRSCPIFTVISRALFVFLLVQM